ncbi:MAG: hypothetical protein QHJ73_19660, partial [Armatimonadota bacterium]|nr:hypothetical protein [Armatimonadota bacterium]
RCPVCDDNRLVPVPRFPGVAYRRCQRCGLLVAERWPGEPHGAARGWWGDASRGWPNVRDAGCPAVGRRPAELFLYTREYQRLSGRPPGRLLCVVRSEELGTIDTCVAAAQRAGWNATCVTMAALMRGDVALEDPPDLVIVLDAAHQCSHPARLLTELRARAAAGAFFLFRVLEWSFAERPRPVTSPLFWPLLFSRPAFDHLCRDAGLEPVHTDSVAAEGQLEVWLRARTCEF